MKSNNENVLTAASSSIYRTQNTSLEIHEERLMALDALIAAGGPKVRDYRTIDQLMQTLYTDVAQGLTSQEEIQQLKALFHDELLQNTIHGYGLRKPLGYAGDFKMIDMIYTHYMTSHTEYRNWDAYFHYQPATCAVRNRKEFFKKQMLDKLDHAAEPMSLLNVANGPARDLSELYQVIEPGKLKTTCIDLDDQAIEYAKTLCVDYLDHIQFNHKNILRFSTSEKFDTIWSAGLFDYFDNKIFIMVLKRFLTWLKPGGEIILGNFSAHNPSRGYMELFGEWILIHRSVEELTALALAAGAQNDNITVDQEPLGINLFLRIRKD
jgi:extracellular factor (EF) 3-hydroxypalmitic acid methyl ester biosynthesis protein